MIRTIQKIVCYLFPIIGFVCILIPDRVTVALPYLLGGTMVLAGIVRGVNDIRNQEFFNRDSYELAHELILLIMGTAFMVKGTKSIVPMGTTWAMIGIRKASQSLGRAIRQIHEKEHCVASVTEFLLRITLALVLLFDPFEKFSAHIAILGLGLIVTSVRLSKNFSPAWDD